MPLSPSPARPGRPVASRLFALLLALHGGLLLAGTGGPVKDLVEFAAQPAAFATPRAAELRFTVLYHDPSWRVLWVQVGSRIHYLQCPKGMPTLRHGELYSVNGYLEEREGLIAPPEAFRSLGPGPVVEALPVAERIDDHGTFSEKRVQVFGLVDKVEYLDARRLLFHLIVQGRRIGARVIWDAAEPPPTKGQFVRLAGIYAYNPPQATAAANIELWVTSPEDVMPEGSLSADPRFALPLTPSDRIAEAAETSYLRVAGVVHHQEPGVSVTLRDAGKQITVQSPQSERLTPGTWVEAVGLPRVRGAETFLAKALFRTLPVGAFDNRPSPESRPYLEFVEEVHSLDPEAATAQPPVRLSGVITWYHRSAPYFFLQDATGGIRVKADAGLRQALRFGGLLNLEGQAVEEEGQVSILATRTQRGPDSHPGTARLVTLDQALGGRVENQWAELVGFVREISAEAPFTLLHVTTPDGDFVAQVSDSLNHAKYLNAVVRLRGVCTLLYNTRHEPSGVRLLVRGAEEIIVESALPTDLSRLPLLPLDRLTSRHRHQEASTWIRTRGQVTYHVPGQFLYLQDGQTSIRVLSRIDAPLREGASVELVGLLGREAQRQVLREARILNPALAETTVVQPLPAPEAPTRNLDGLLVELSGTLVNRVDHLGDRHLSIEHHGHLVEALWRGSPQEDSPPWLEVGARLKLTGIYRVELNDYREPVSYQLLMRRASDLVLEQPAPWWNRQRAISALGALTLFAGLAIGWVTLLRRTLHRQTKELLEQRAKEAKLEAELERSSRLESLGTLAGGIAHDFNNILTVVVGNLTLAILETPAQAKAAEYLNEAEQASLKARQLTQQLLTFSRGGEPTREAHRLPPLIEEAASFALRGSSVKCEFEFDSDLPPALVDQTQFTQAVNNLVLYAAQSMPQGGTIQISLRLTRVFDKELPHLVAGNYLKLTVRDNGPGIPPEWLGRVFDPYFSTQGHSQGLGLATVHSIIRRHHGHVEVSSKTGQGTLFHVWVPEAQALPAGESHPPNPPSEKRSLRILFMDDDEGIRRFAQTVLTRMGHAPVMVADGTAAVHAYAAAFEANQPYDVVILDLTVVGGMGGKEAIEHLLNIDPQVRAIVSSGYSSDPVMSDHRAFGFSGIVSKPYRIHDLEKNLHEVMKSPPPTPPRD